MKKAHTVRKNGAQRMGIRILTLLFYGAVAGCTVWSRQGLLFLSFVPWLLMMTALLLYFESWQIHMTRDTIRKSVCGIDVGPYSFQQIVDVSQFSSRTDHQYVVLTFWDGKKMKFRLEDDGAEAALREIGSHRSIASG